MNWFTTTKIDKYTYVISEQNHWEHTHSYLLIGEDKAMLIDTGTGVKDIKTVVESITDLPIVVILTHVHWDHIGSVNSFDNVYVHENELRWLNDSFPLPLAVVKNELTKLEQKFPGDFILDEYKIPQKTDAKILTNHTLIQLGNREIRVIHTPGHSPGHICLYDEKNKYLFTGDLIYQGRLLCSFPSTDPNDYYKSVRNLKGLPVSKIFPGHHSLEITTDIIDEVHDAFSSIKKNDKLIHGSGVFHFKKFEIEL